MNANQIFAQSKLSKAAHVADFCNLHDIVIVSYGLAPNPNGFCYEMGDSTCAAACDVLEDMLDSLNSRDEAELRKLVF